MKQQDLLELINKYLDGTATEEEQNRLHQYYNSFQQTTEWNEQELGSEKETGETILHRLITDIRHQQSASVVPFYKRAGWKVAAAVVVFATSVASWLFLNKEEERELAKIAPTQKRYKASSKNVTLTLNNGQVIVLDSSADGVLVQLENTTIYKKGESITVDVPAEKVSNDETITGFHILQIPKGQQYKAVLADGSQVWLNAATSLRFPAVFAADERKIELTGEAYFEVVKDAERPFRVLAVSHNKGREKTTLVEVLGTHFNINAYEDEGRTKTTLLEGSVKVAAVQDSLSSVARASVLMPGEQAEVSLKDTTETVAVKKTDVEEAVAWQQNIFHFKNTDLQSILRQLARWYDVEVVYARGVPLRHFSGKISRSSPLATVLEILEQSNIRFTIKGNQIIVKA